MRHCKDFQKIAVLPQPTMPRFKLRRWRSHAGYRVGSIPGHHRVSFEATKLALGKSGAHLADYFDACRRKRNEIDYTGAAIATATEADEILLHAKSFLKLVEGWIASAHPALIP
jgi:hypothetical protein